MNDHEQIIARLLVNKSSLHRLRYVMLVFGFVASIFIWTNHSSAAGYEQVVAADRMAQLGLVKGRDGAGDFALSETITRAEMVTILVRALGQESTAQLLAGAPAFADSNDHWASGYVALAKNLGITSGRTPTTFEPDAPLTAAEAVAFLVKFLGSPVNDQLGWPHSYLAAAMESGFVTEDDDFSGIANSPATREMAFFFADQAFSQVKLENGKTTYQTYAVTDPPSLSINWDGPSATMDSSITVSGNVSGHTALYIGGRSVTTLDDGSFSEVVVLEPNIENVIIVRAVDLVENETVREIRVMQIAPSPPELTIDYPAYLRTTASTINVTGTVSEDAVAVYIGDNNIVASIEQDGKFSGSVSLKENQVNEITVTAVNAFGGETTRSIRVEHYTPSPWVENPSPKTSIATVTEVTYDLINGGHDIQFHFILRSTEYIYAIIQPASDPAPSASQVKDGKDVHGNLLSLLDSDRYWIERIAQEIGEMDRYHWTVFALSFGPQFDGMIYIVAEDRNGVLSEVYSLQFSIN